jgi:uncharacterized LabA/DUF88 family protein
MHRVAIFVDAGYLFAQGSAALTGSKKVRSSLILDAPAVVAELKNLAAVAAPGATLLRIYWYDGAIGGTRVTGDQALLANLDDVKVRLGFVNNVGQQKGVDSLIVTDLIELARQKAIFDAVLLSGDEDVRVGVQIAQNYGVRVHLLGIAPSRGSQSNQLLQEADTTHEWRRDTVRRFISERATATPGAEGSALAAAESALHGRSLVVEQLAEAASHGHSLPEDHDPRLNDAVENFVESLQESDLEGLEAYWKSARGLPPELDKRLLPHGRAVIGRDLSVTEKRFVRSRVQALVKARARPGAVTEQPSRRK